MDAALGDRAYALRSGAGRMPPAQQTGRTDDDVALLTGVLRCEDPAHGELQRSRTRGCGQPVVRHLHLKAWLGLLFLALAMGLLLFVPAGTIRFWQAWVFLVFYFAPSLAIVFYAMRKDPALLERRMRGGPTFEKEKPQEIIMSVASAGFIAMLVVPALDHRFGWSHVPLYLELVGDVMAAGFFGVAFLAVRANPFASATVEIAEGQKVVSTGPYALVRHPMYAGGLLLFIGSPLALGSWWGLVPFAAALPALIWRLFDEERLLKKNLPGYTEYCEEVRWRMIPGVF